MVCLKLKILILHTLFIVSIYAQNGSNPLNYMVGKWRGSGWMMNQTGKQYTTITESVSCKVNCSVLSVEGVGTKMDTVTQKQITVHDAFGIISKDGTLGKWMMRAYRVNDVIDAEIEFVQEKIIRWVLPLPHNSGIMRFTTDFTEENTWKGKGEYSRDGQTWMIIMETNLSKLKE